MRRGEIWEIVVHFSRFPNDALVALDDYDFVEMYYFTFLKESTHNSLGSARAIMELTVSKRDEIEKVLKGDASQVSKIHKILEIFPSVWNDGSDRKIPLRLHHHDKILRMTSFCIRQPDQ